MALVSKAFSKGGDKIDFVDNFPLMGLQFGASGFRHPIYKLSAEQKSFAFPIWCLFYLSSSFLPLQRPFFLPGAFFPQRAFFSLLKKWKICPSILWKKRPQFVKKEPLCGKIAPFVEKTPPDESGKSALHLWKNRPQLWKKSPKCEKSAPLWKKRPKCGKNAPGRKKPFRNVFIVRYLLSISNHVVDISTHGLDSLQPGHWTATTAINESIGAPTAIRESIGGHHVFGWERPP